MVTTVKGLVNQVYELELRRLVLAAMETGNIERAGTIVRETEALYPDFGAELRQDVLDAYQVELRE